MQIWCQQRSGEGFKYSIVGVSGGCKPPCRCLELNQGTLKKQQVLLTT